MLKPCCLGDVLLTTPLLATLRHGYPDAHITYAVGSWSRPMVETSRHVDAVMTIPDRWTPGSIVAVARALRQRQFDAVFIPERSPLPGIVATLARIPVRIGLDSYNRGFTYTYPVPVPEIVTHEADLYLLLARAVGLRPVVRRLWFFPTDEDRQEAQATWRPSPVRGRSSCSIQAAGAIPVWSFSESAGCLNAGRAC